MEIDEFIGSNFVQLARFASSLAGNRQDAEDVLSESLLKITLHWARVSRADYPTAYARAIIARTYLDFRRARLRRREILTSDELLLDRAHWSTPDDQSSILVANVLASLTPKQRVAVIMRYIGGSSDSEIAKVLRCTTATVRSHVSHARATLRAQLEITE